MPMYDLTLEGEHVRLLPERAVYLPVRSQLIIADPHLGKDAAFRRQGIPAPALVNKFTLHQLDQVIARTEPRQLIVLGDLIHDETGCDERTIEEVADWRRQHPMIDITLVLGNHDAHVDPMPEEWDVTCVTNITEEPFEFHHMPREDAHARKAGHGRSTHPFSDRFGFQADQPTTPPRPMFRFAGHWHPAALLRDMGGSGSRLPCFVLDQRQRTMVLPAFGVFTGMRAVPRRAGRSFFIIAGSSIAPPR